MEKRLKRLTGAFLAMAVLIVAGIVVMYLIGEVVIQDTWRINSHLQTIDVLSITRGTLRDAESAQRYFFNTEDPKDLDLYYEAKGREKANLEQVDELGRAGKIGAQQAGEIHQLVQAKFNEMDNTIDLWRKQGRPAALQLMRSGQGEATMVQLSGLITTMIATQTGNVSRYQQDTTRNTIWRNVLFTVVGVANLLFLGWMYRRVSMEMQARETALAAAEEQRELLTVTLRSIGDAVIVTDTLGQVTFMNQVAENLTGYSEADARGMAISRVFHIINEHTRDEAESPVQKVLREGQVVGLANHTLLVRRDGTETPIDDSGAPVRDRHGQIHGVVLVFRDFSEHKQHEAQMEDARKKAERASQAKDQFMAALSHELRTPLTPVLALLTTWEAHRQLPEPFVADLQMMRRNVELEARLIDDLLDLTRVVKGKLTINVELTDLHSILNHVLQTCQSEANAKHVRVAMHLDALHHFVMADPARMQQIFWNILRNATKFSRADGNVVVQTRDTDNDLVEISITDEGIGMGQDTLERLFRPFEQGGPMITRRYGGLGLGLAISKALVDIQGGSLAAESGGLGKGSRFTVKLRPTAAVAMETEGNPAENGGLPAPSRKLRILLIEDHVDTARTMRRLLSELGHSVEMAGSVSEALAAAKREPPDLILSDIGLPDGDGVDLLAKLRAFTAAPAIALTGFGMDEDLARTAAAGFWAHLTKPVNFQRLETMVFQVASNVR